MESYNAFANYYDVLTENVDYKNLAEYLDCIIKKEGNGGNLILDLACGTGSLSFELVKKGYDVVSVDGSEEMLSEAMNKAETFGNPIFLNQSMQNLDLFGTIDAAVCTLDSINHLKTKKDVEKAIERVSLFLNNGGLFIFDVNTLYKHKEVLSQNSFIYDTDKVYCVWQNQFLEEDSSVNITLDFFEKKKNGDYIRFFEEFSEQYYDDNFIIETLRKYKLICVNRFDDFTNNPVNEKTQRIVYVCRKEK